MPYSYCIAELLQPRFNFFPTTRRTSPRAIKIVYYNSLLQAKKLRTSSCTSPHFRLSVSRNFENSPSFSSGFGIFRAGEQSPSPNKMESSKDFHMGPATINNRPSLYFVLILYNTSVILKIAANRVRNMYVSYAISVKV